MSDDEDTECPMCGRAFDTKRGLKIHRGSSHQDEGRGERQEELIADLQDIAAKLGEPPTSTDIRNGDYDTASVPTYRKYFDTWNDALRAAGFQIHQEQEADPKALLTDLERVADDLGRPPSRDEYEEHGAFTGPCFRNHFGSWNNAMEAAGFDINWEPADPDALLADIERLAEELGRTPMQQDVQEHGEYAVVTYHRHFGSWNAALEKVGLEPTIRRDIPREELLADLRRVDTLVDGRPSRSDHVEHGEFSSMTLADRFGSWDAAVQELGYGPYADLDLTGAQNSAWKGGFERYYGPNWVQQRRWARERDDYRCQVCGMTDEEHKEQCGRELEVHHITPVRAFYGNEGELDYEAANDLENLITLCREDHAKWEGVPLRPHRAD